MPITNTFHNMYTLDQFMSADVGVTQDKWVELGYYEVVPGQELSPGYGQQADQQNAVGRIYAQFKDNQATPAEVKGRLRLSVYSHQDQPMNNGIVFELRTEQLSTSATDRRLQIPFPRWIGDISAFKRLKLEFKADATATIAKANSTMLMDVTDMTVV